jgi:hypothetical protein
MLEIAEKYGKLAWRATADCAPNQSADDTFGVITRKWRSSFRLSGLILAVRTAGPDDNPLGVSS